MTRWASFSVRRRHRPLRERTAAATLLIVRAAGRSVSNRRASPAPTLACARHVLDLRHRRRRQRARRGQGAARRRPRRRRARARAPARRRLGAVARVSRADDADAGRAVSVLGLRLPGGAAGVAAGRRRPRLPARATPTASASASASASAARWSALEPRTAAAGPSPCGATGRADRRALRPRRRAAAASSTGRCCRRSTGRAAFEQAGGRVLHSAHCTDPALLEGRRVVIVGIQKTATDLAVYAAGHGAHGRHRLPPPALEAAAPLPAHGRHRRRDLHPQLRRAEPPGDIGPAADAPPADRAPRGSAVRRACSFGSSS